MEVDQARRDRLGLALSGGGFRASLFHIGVLARLAEVGLLSQVEVISNVSGGSIVGAAYYLHLKHLLESKPDAEITNEDYVELVRELEARFSEGVAKNIRARIFLNPLRNLRMLLPNYSRSERVGELYDRHFYKPLWRPEVGEDEEKGAIPLRKLLIRPNGHEGWFDPRKENPRRQAKVPALLINATTLNSGRNWRFEAFRMGEPLPENTAAIEISAEIDANVRLEQGYFEPYEDKPLVPERHRNFGLGCAVAASAAVPALFHPLSISSMYEGIRVQLVDGGVHDNQGIQGLIDQDCTDLIVSDASGQMPDAKRPAPFLPTVVGRTLSVYGDRIRDAQLVNARAAKYPMALMHLRKGLRGEVRLPGRPEEAAKPGLAASNATEFGVDPEVQDLLSRVRTDLDRFSDLEAHSLALDGYLMTAFELAEGEMMSGMPASQPIPVDPGAWAFGSVAAEIGSPSPAYLDHLRTARHRFGRRLIRTLRRVF